MEKVRIANEWMQELKLRIYNADTYEEKNEELVNKYEEIQGALDLLDIIYKNSVRRFKIMCIFSLGILYIKKKNNLKLLDEMIEESRNLAYEEYEEWNNQKNLLERDINFKDEYIKYYKQIDNFLNLVRGMSKEEKEKILNYKM